MTLEEVAGHVNRKVVYRAPHAASDEPGEEGVITGYNSVYAFVRYGLTGDGIATPPNCLELVAS